MRRALPAIAATVAGLGILSQFRTTSGAPTAAAQASTARSTATPAPGGGATTTTAPARGGAPSTTAPPVGSATKTVDGPVVSNRFGDVQVEVVVQAGKLVDVKALVLPSDRARSARISQQAGPILRSEALTAQSANIDTLSGATYTSESYARSLQAALDAATK